MKYLILILCLVCSVAFGQTIRYDDVDIEMNDKYSGKGYPYHGLSFKGEKMKDINIYGSCFYQEWQEGEVMKDIFPDDMKGVTFYNCNLDNVYVDETKNTIVGGSNRAISVQNDWEDWILKKADKKPKEPINKEQRIEKGLSIDPDKIPKTKWTKKERDAFEDNLNSINVTP